MRTLAAFIMFELRLQRREFLTWLAALVFLLLPFGYGASGVVELVGNRGTVPRAAPWAVAQAMAGLTAFGQVITAMIAATSVLRDIGLRTQELILTTSLPWPRYLLGRFLGTLAVLLMVYAMIPLGMALGFTLGDPLAVGPWPLRDLLAPFAALVVPTVVLIAAIFFAAGALSGGFPLILLVGIGLVALWQTGLSLVMRGVAAGAWIDPFGNALLTLLTQRWSEADRQSALLPWSGILLWHRIAWLIVALGFLLWTLRGWRFRLNDGHGAAYHLRATPTAAKGTDTTVVPRTLARASSRWSLACQQSTAEWRFGWHWVRTERGIMALVFLAVINAAVNGWPVATDSAALLTAVEFHARLFGILVATIYAGELVWRDRDVRADAMLRAMPGIPGVRLMGRTIGVLCGLLMLPVALWGMAVLLPLLRGATPTPVCAARWVLGVSTPLFIVMLVGSLVIQLLVRSKTVAHLVVIGGWVTAIALGGRALAAPWTGYGIC